MKKENSAVRLDTQAEAAPKLELVPSSPEMNLESEVSAALQNFKDNRQKLADMEKRIAEHLPEAGQEDNASILRYEGDKSDVVEWSKVMLMQLPTLKELEYMVTDPKSSKEIKSALNFLEELKTKYQSLELPGAAAGRKFRSQESIGVQLRNREQIELKEQEDKARKATAVMRRDLANLKRSFYKMYGMTYNEALVLPSSPKPAEGQAPKGFWGKLADKVWAKPQNPEELKLEAAKSKDAKALIKKIQSLDKQVETAWNDTMGQYAQESEPQTAISLDTLRSVLEQEMPEKSPKEINNSAYRIIKSLRLALPEEISEPESQTMETGTYPIPVAVKTETFQLPKAKKENPATLKVAREEKPEVKEAEKSDRKQIAIEIMKAFGGGEQARQRGSNLFEAVKNQMQLMKLEDMDPLDYVQLVAERTQAENENDEKAAKEYDKQIQALNKKLSFGSTDPSKGINMGNSRLMEARALGSTPARAEAAKMVEQITAMPSQTAERPSLRKPKQQMEEVEPKTLRKPRSLRTVKPEAPEPQVFEPKEIPAPPEVLTDSMNLKEKLDRPMDLQLAAHYVPNARLVWDTLDKAITNDPQVIPEIQKLVDKIHVPDAGHPATTLVYAVGEYLRLEEEFLNNDEIKVDTQTENEVRAKLVKLGQTLRRIESKIKIDLFGTNGFLEVAAWDPDNMSDAEIDDKYAKAQETIPNYGSFARAVKEQTGMDDEALLKKYFVAIENYLEEVKRGNKDRINDSENAWRRLDENLGIEHPIMKDLLYSEPEGKSQMSRIGKRTGRSSARDKSWRQ